MMNVPGVIKEESSLASKVCRIAFCLYVVFMLVGASMPFQDADPNDEIAASNPINQVVDSVIPLVCLVCLWPKRRTALDILKQEKYLVLFLAWCAVTVIWSESPFSSLKASVRIIGSTIVAMAFFVNARSSEEALKYIKGVLAVYIPVSFLAIAFVHGATQWEWPAWRGLAAHKNTLGEIALVSVIVWTFGIRQASAKGRVYCSLFGVASLVLVLGSKSTTALLTLFFICFIALCFAAARWVGPALTTAAAGCCCVIGMLVMVNVAGSDEIFAGLGKDTTFTGRTDLWEAIVDEAKAHPFLGAGFGGFWTPDRDLRLETPEESAWRPTEGHEGYLDLLNETGVVGVCLLALMVVFYFRNAARFKDHSNLWKSLLISVLIVNTMESTLFRLGSFTGWVFVLSYLALYADLVQQKERSALPLQLPPAARAA
jgi:exopolysaccharide production protein ExoQ